MPVQRQAYFYRQGESDIMTKNGTVLAISAGTVMSCCGRFTGSCGKVREVKMAENSIGRNIRSLRECFGETQLQLANILELNSVGAISNYENGTRLPERSVLEKIALHYRITLDELINSDLSEISRISFDGITWDHASEAIDCLLPVYSTVSAMENEAFRLAYEAQVQIMDSIKKGGESLPSRTDLPLLYEECLEECGAPAAANLAAWLLLTRFIETAPASDSGKEGLLAEMLVKSNCRDIDLEDEETKLSTREAHSRGEEIDAMLVPLLRRLRKAGGEYTELAEYYCALRYISNLAGGNLSEDAARMVGGEMLSESCRLGNTVSLKVMRSLNRLMSLE